ncbi:MAG: heavy-metal-associated domain-containing protein [Chitinophagales bacterium]
MVQRFSTNIHCNSCLRAVTPYILEVQGIEKWSVDLNSEQKVLSVWGDVPQEKILQAVRNAGYDIAIFKQQS